MRVCTAFPFPSVVPVDCFNVSRPLSLLCYIRILINSHQSDVEHGASIGSGCEIGAGARIAPNTCMLDGVVVFRNGVNGEQSTGVAPRALEEHRISIDVHRQSLLQAGSRFLREHRP